MVYRGIKRGLPLPKIKQETRKQKTFPTSLFTMFSVPNSLVFSAFLYPYNGGEFVLL